MAVNDPNLPATKPEAVVEKKVTAASLGALGSSLLLAILLGLADDPQRLAGLPEWASWLVMIVLPVVIVFVSGYAAPHTSRPDL